MGKEEVIYVEKLRKNDPILDEYITNLETKLDRIESEILSSPMIMDKWSKTIYPKIMKLVDELLLILS